MKLATLALATALGFTGTCALAQTGSGSTGGGSATGGTAATGTTTGASGTTTGSSTGGSLNSGMSNDAGSAAAARNSGLNPSGNTHINPSPSGSTLTPSGPGSATGR